MRRTHNKQYGATLIEIIIVMVVVGILGASLGSFIPTLTASSASTLLRAELSNQASAALWAMKRELRDSVPNSIRSTSSGGVEFLEFVPLHGGGRYRNGGATSSSFSVCPSDDPALPAGAAQDQLSVSIADSCMKSLGPSDVLDASVGDWLVLFNLGTGNPGANIYESGAATGGNKAKITNLSSNSNEAKFMFESNTFPYASPFSTFHIASATPVTYACDPGTGELKKYSGYAMSTNQPTSFSGSGAIMAKGVESCSFQVVQGSVSARFGQVLLQLRVRKGSEFADTVVSVRVANVP